MATASLTLQKPREDTRFDQKIRGYVEGIQACWSPGERQRRAEEGRSRRQRLLGLMLHSASKQQ